MSDAPETHEIKRLLEVRKQHILHVLRSANGDLDRASRVLGISLASLKSKIKQYGIDDQQEQIETEPQQ